MDDANVLNWSGLIAPVSEPYSAGAFKFTLTFPADYPFRAPKFKMQTPIYHPNFNEQGEVCLGLLNEWKPATKIGDVLTALVHLIHAPEPDHPLRAELAEQFQQDRAKFDAVRALLRAPAQLAALL